MAQERDITIEELLESKTPEKSAAKLSFEQGMKLLESLVSKVESGSLPLDTAVKAYELGVLLSDHLRNLLSGAEEKLKLLERAPDGKFDAKSISVGGRGEG